MEDSMSNKRLIEIAKEVYFCGCGRVDWNELRTEYKLSESEINYVASIIRHL